VLRDLLLKGQHTFKEFQASEEGIARNILADRLDLLQRGELIKSERDSPRIHDRSITSPSQPVGRYCPSSSRWLIGVQSTIRRRRHSKLRLLLRVQQTRKRCLMVGRPWSVMTYIIAVIRHLGALRCSNFDAITIET